MEKCVAQQGSSRAWRAICCTCSSSGPSTRADCCCVTATLLRFLQSNDSLSQTRWWVERLAWFTGLVSVSYSATTNAKSCFTFQLNAGARSASTSMLSSNRSVPSDFRNVRNLLTPSFLTSGNPGHPKHELHEGVIIETRGQRTSCTPRMYAALQAYLDEDRCSVP